MERTKFPYVQIRLSFSNANGEHACPVFSLQWPNQMRYSEITTGIRINSLTASEPSLNMQSCYNMYFFKPLKRYLNAYRQ